MGGEANRKEEPIDIEKAVTGIEMTDTHYEPTINVVMSEDFTTLPADFATALINRNCVTISFWLEHIFPKHDSKKGFLSEQLVQEQRLDVKIPTANAQVIALYILRTIQRLQQDPTLQGSFYGPSRIGQKPKEGSE